MTIQLAQFGLVHWSSEISLPQEDHPTDDRPIQNWQHNPRTESSSTFTKNKAHFKISGNRPLIRLLRDTITPDMRGSILQPLRKTNLAASSLQPM